MPSGQVGDTAHGIPLFLPGEVIDAILSFLWQTFDDLLWESQTVAVKAISRIDGNALLRCLQIA